MTDNLLNDILNIIPSKNDIFYIIPLFIPSLEIFGCGISCIFGFTISCYACLFLNLYEIPPRGRLNVATRENFVKANLLRSIFILVPSVGIYSCISWMTSRLITTPIIAGGCSFIIPMSINMFESIANYMTQ